MFRELLAKIKAGILHKDPNVALVSLSVLCNFFMSCAKVVFGIYFGSGWLLINALYIVLLGVLRFYTLKSYVHAKTIEDNEQKYIYGYSVHRFGGSLIFAVAGTYLLCSLRMFFVGDAVVIGLRFAFCLLLFTLVKFGFAVYGMIITRHKENLILRLMKVIGIVDVTISIVPTSYALMSFYCFKYSVDVSSVLGMLISTGVMISGIVMIRRKYNYEGVAHLMYKERDIEDYIKKIRNSRKY